MLRDRAYCLCVHTLEGEEGGGPSADALKSAKAAALRKARRDEAARLKRENDMQTKAGWTLSYGAAAKNPRLVFLSAMKLRADSSSLSIPGTRASSTTSTPSPSSPRTPCATSATGARCAP